MIRILAYTRAGREFETADALNELGALAISPRKVETIRLPKQRRPQVVESPFLSNYLFCAMDPDHWHQAKRDNIAFTICRDIGPHEWRNVQAFAQRITPRAHLEPLSLEATLAYIRPPPRRRL